MMVGFTGLRGVVSVAAVLSIPVAIGRSGFPDRNLILAITFGVIAVTLVGQGGLLPLVIHRLGLDREGRAEAERDKKDERDVRRGAVKAALSELDQIEADGAQPKVVTALREEEQHRLGYYEKSEIDPSPHSPSGVPVIKARLLAAERNSVAKAYAEGRLSDDARRRLERELDLEETRAKYASSSLSAPGAP